MSTRSVIGHIDTNGKIKAVYCHYDGYPKRMIPAIESLIKDRGTDGFRNMVIEALSKGGMRCINIGEYETFGEASSSEEWGYTLDDILEGNHQQFCYIVDNDKNIIMAHTPAGRKSLKEIGCQRSS